MWVVIPYLNPALTCSFWSQRPLLWLGDRMCLLLVRTHLTQGETAAFKLGYVSNTNWKHWHCLESLPMRIWSFCTSATNDCCMQNANEIQCIPQKSRQRVLVLCFPANQTDKRWDARKKHQAGIPFFRHTTSLVAGDESVELCLEFAPNRAWHCALRPIRARAVPEGSQRIASVLNMFPAPPAQKLGC